MTKSGVRNVSIVVKKLRKLEEPPAVSLNTWNGSIQNCTRTTRNLEVSYYIFYQSDLNC